MPVSALPPQEVKVNTLDLPLEKLPGLSYATCAEALERNVPNTIRGGFSALLEVIAQDADGVWYADLSRSPYCMSKLGGNELEDKLIELLKKLPADDKDKVLTEAKKRFANATSGANPIATAPTVAKPPRPKSFLGGLWYDIRWN